ncbi:MAG: response regulator, partial [Flavobacteriales bacterium]
MTQNNKKILLVEDEESLTDVISMNLDMEGYEVIKTSSGTQAIEAFSNRRFDLIILDVMLPEMDG